MESNLNSTSIKALRCRMGWCRSELAQRLGVSSQVIQAWELGQEKPNLDQAQTIARLFRQTEDSMQEILQSPVAESLLDSTVLESVNLSQLHPLSARRK